MSGASPESRPVAVYGIIQLSRTAETSLLRGRAKALPLELPSQKGTISSVDDAELCIAHARQVGRANRNALAYP
eukprot:2713222-Pyramimonas_sp.AAC.2